MPDDVQNEIYNYIITTASDLGIIKEEKKRTNEQLCKELDEIKTKINELMRSVQSLAEKVAHVEKQANGEIAHAG